MPGRSLRDEMQGVAPVRSFGAPLGAQAPANAPDRPKVGPASQASQHSALEQAGLYRKPVGSTATPPVRRTPAPAPAASPNPASNPTRDLTVGTAVQRIQSYPSQVDKAIEEQGK